MYVKTHTDSRWSFARLMDGMGTIRIAIPVWRLPQEKTAAAKPVAKVSQEELLNIFQSELRPAKRVGKLTDAGFVFAETMRRQAGTSHQAA
ncbi:MAG: hypothetical protein ACRC6I_01025 [Paracoccaceae bacterium]